MGRPLREITVEDMGLKAKTIGKSVILGQQVGVNKYRVKDSQDEIVQLGYSLAKEGDAVLELSFKGKKEPVIKITTHLFQTPTRAVSYELEEDGKVKFLESNVEFVDYSDSGKDYEPVSSEDDIKDALNNDEPEVCLELTEDVNLAKGHSFTIKSGKKAEIKVDGDITCEREGFVVEDGAELVLKGEGTITATTKQTNAAISVDGANALLTIDGITIDAVADKGKDGNYAFGVYLLNDACMNFKSGVIKTAYGSCISSNNTTGGSQVVNISGGELYSDGSYAIYIPAQGEINITGGKVQGVNARMGKINISGDAEIIPTTITEDTYDNIGKEFNTSGCVWLGDTIAVMAGTYKDDEGTDCEINISGDATVKSDFRSAVGVYMVDTNEAQNVTINIENPANVKTTDAEFKDVEVYDHDYITAEASKAHKSYKPKATSNVVINY